MQIILITFFLSLKVFCALPPELSLPKLPDLASINWQWSNGVKSTVVIFISADCPCSHGHIKYLKELKEKYPEFKFFAIHSNTDEDLKMTQAYFTSVKLNFDLLQDSNSFWANQFSASRTPHSFVVNPQGEIVYQGGVTNSSQSAKADEFYLAEALESINNNQPIKVGKTRVLGCEITRE